MGKTNLKLKKRREYDVRSHQDYHFVSDNYVGDGSSRDNPIASFSISLSKFKGLVEILNKTGEKL